MGRNREILLWLLAAVVMVCVTVVAAMWYRSNGQEPEAVEEIDDGRITYQGKEYLPNSSLQTVLLIGIDRELDAQNVSYNNQLQSDFLLLLVLDHREQSYWMLHLNRDTMCDIPILDLNGSRIGYRNGQLALAHTYGTGEKDSCINTVKAVSRLLYDVEVQSYARIPVQAVAALNDAVGGVDVTVEDDFSGVDDSLVMGERVHLTGKQAETFIRARSGMADSSNLRRMERQRQYLRGLMEKLEAGQGSGMLDRAVDALNADLTTDLSAGSLSQLGQALEDYTFIGFVTLPGSAAQGETYMEYTLDADALQRIVVEQFYHPIG